MKFRKRKKNRRRNPLADYATLGKQFSTGLVGFMVPGFVYSVMDKVGVSALVKKVPFLATTGKSRMTFSVLTLGAGYLSMRMLLKDNSMVKDFGDSLLLGMGIRTVHDILDGLVGVTGWQQTLRGVAGLSPTLSGYDGSQLALYGR